MSEINLCSKSFILIFLTRYRVYIMSSCPHFCSTSLQHKLCPHLNSPLARSLARVTLPLKGTPLSIPLACRLAAKYLLLCVPTGRVASSYTSSLARELSLWVGRRREIVISSRNLLGGESRYIYIFWMLKESLFFNILGSWETYLFINMAGFLVDWRASSRKYLWKLFWNRMISVSMPAISRKVAFLI